MTFRLKTVFFSVDLNFDRPKWSWCAIVLTYLHIQTDFSPERKLFLSSQVPILSFPLVEDYSIYHSTVLYLPVESREVEYSKKFYWYWHISIFKVITLEDYLLNFFKETLIRQFSRGRRLLCTKRVGTAFKAQNRFLTGKNSANQRGSSLISRLLAWTRAAFLGLLTLRIIEWRISEEFLKVLRIFLTFQWNFFRSWYFQMKIQQTPTPKFAHCRLKWRKFAWRVFDQKPKPSTSIKFSKP